MLQASRGIGLGDKSDQGDLRAIGEKERDCQRNYQIKISHSGIYKLSSFKIFIMIIIYMFIFENCSEK